jgi:hypothetical protein
MYFVDLDLARGSLQALKLVPLQIKNFRLTIPAPADIEWMRGTLERECRPFGTRVTPAPDGQLEVAAQPSGNAPR